LVSSWITLAISSARDKIAAFTFETSFTRFAIGTSAHSAWAFRARSVSEDTSRRTSSRRSSGTAGVSCASLSIAGDYSGTIGAMELSAKFEDAQARVKQLSKAPSTDDLLELYALYKQATTGDVSGSRPGMLDMKGRAKFDAWTKKKGTSKDDAMTKYVALVDRLGK
jgi:acyl-CoA-binding protein